MCQAQNNSLYANSELSHASVIPTRAEGRIAIVTNAGWDVVDAGGAARSWFAGRVTP